MGGGWIFMTLFWGVVLVGIVALVKWLVMQSSQNAAPRARTPFEILQERYARGEVDRDEYEQKKRDLSG